MSENSCQLCAIEKLTFEPPPIYCTPCGARIKRNAMYYTVGAGDTRHYFCIPCYNETRGDTIEAEGSTFPKSRLEKKKNDEETEEWVCSSLAIPFHLLFSFLLRVKSCDIHGKYSFLMFTDKFCGFICITVGSV